MPRHRSRSLVIVHAVFVPLALIGCDRGSPPPAGDASAPSEPAAPAAPPPPSIVFTDVTADSGIDMVMRSGATPTSQILEVNGGGLGLIDYDDDGDLDLFVANGATLDDPEAGPGSRLYENLGGLAFRDVTKQSRIALNRWAMGVAVGDVDGDRRDDLYVTCYGPNVLLRNRGDGTFESIADRSGTADESWGTSSAFGDIDGDGDLDLYVVNYLEFDHERPPRPASYKGVRVMAGPHGLTATHDLLYENDGSGAFSVATSRRGCRPTRAAYGLNVAILDLDGDGHQDIFVANDSMPNFYFHNDGAGAFEPSGMSSGLAGNADGSMQASMGIAIADVDGNLRPDVFTTNFSSDTNTLHLNLDGRFFEDRTPAWGLGMVSREYLGWSCGFHDFDHDGDEDLLMFNGHVYPQATRERMDSDYEQEPLLFAREGERYRRMTSDDPSSWLSQRHRDRCAVFADLDGDGDIDVVVGELNGPVRVLENRADPGTWLIVRLKDARPGQGNHRGLGSRLRLDAGGESRMRWIFSGGGFQSAGAAEAHFVIPAPDPAATLTVTWPDGAEQVVDAPAFGRVLTVERANGTGE
jgi:hypothetical protein